MQRVGKYQLLRKLATGGMAEVFLARAEGPMGFQKRLVVKRILPHFVEDPSFVGMFLGEAKLAAELDHPNLVQIFDFGEAEGQYYLAMEFIDGPNLRVLNVTARARGRPLSYPMAARVIGYAAEGLHAAHELRDDRGQLVHLVHRDISPDNILISRNGTVKVVDFGIAKVASEPSRTKSGVIKGKLAYMPPEQLAREPLDRRADIFALGVVLYELIAGAMPFDATSEVSIIQAIMNEEPLERVRTKAPDVPAELDEIIAKCLAKNQAERYPTCKALHGALEKFIASSGQTVFASDLAQVIDELVPAITDSAVSAVSANKSGPAFDPTVPTRQSANRPAVDRGQTVAGEAPSEPALTRVPDDADVPDEEGSNGTSATHMRPAISRAAPAPAAQNRGQLIQVAVVLLVLGFVGGALAVFRPWQKVEPQLVAKVPAKAEPDVAPTPVAIPPVAVVDQVDPLDGGVAVIEPDVVVAVPVTAIREGTPSVRMGHLELRIRPFAQVFIDGRPVGETPLPALQLPAGKHRLRLVNRELDKNVEQDIVVRAGENNVFKLNLKE